MVKGRAAGWVGAIDAHPDETSADDTTQHATIIRMGPAIDDSFGRARSRLLHPAPKLVAIEV